MIYLQRPFNDIANGQPDRTIRGQTTAIAGILYEVKVAARSYIFSIEQQGLDAQQPGNRNCLKRIPKHEVSSSYSRPPGQSAEPIWALALFPSHQILYFLARHQKKILKVPAVGRKAVMGGKGVSPVRPRTAQVAGLFALQPLKRAVLGNKGRPARIRLQGFVWHKQDIVVFGLCHPIGQ